MRNTLSPLRYPGGKTCLVPILRDAIERSGMSGCTFVEPFAGSGAAALYLLFGEHVESIDINDFDFRIYCFWWSILNQPEALCEMIQTEPLTIQNWEQQRLIYQNADRRSKLKLGFATLYLNRCNRSGIIESAGPIGGKSQSGRWKIDARFNRASLCEKVNRIAFFSERIRLWNKDGLKFLQTVIQRRAAVKRHFVFLDPPYVNKAERLYASRLTPAFHTRLSKHLLGTAMYRWLLTYDAVSVVEDLYRPRNPVQFSLTYSAQQNRRGKELLITSPRLEVNMALAPFATSAPTS